MINEFKKGQKYQCIKSLGNFCKVGDIETIIGLDWELDPILSESKEWKKSQFIRFWKKLEDKTMDKYATLKQQIEDLDGDSSLKEWDDLLIEMNLEQKYSINIVPSFSGSIHIRNYCVDKKIEHFGFNNQYEKLEALKKAYLYLLDHSDIPKIDKKKDTIEQLQIDLAKIGNRIKKLEV